MQFCFPGRILAFLKKADKIEGMMGGLGAGEGGLDPRYEEYFVCFNEQRYYDAHDVLEHLWLRTRDENHAFYKGLIQLAGAFVHLKKQFERPDHPVDRTRARPAARLFQLAARNLAGYRPRHLRLDVERAWGLSTGLAEEITRTGYVNPWTPETAPRLSLEPAE